MGEVEGERLRERERKREIGSRTTNLPIELKDTARSFFLDRTSIDEEGTTKRGKYNGVISPR